MFFTRPKLVGTVTDSIWFQSIEDARRGEYHRYLLLKVTAWNAHRIPSSVVEWVAELDYSNGEKERIPSDRCPDGSWRVPQGDLEAMREEVVLTKYVRRSGWLRFRVSLHLNDEARITDTIRRVSLLAVDGRGRAHQIYRGKPPE